MNEQLISVNPGIEIKLTVGFPKDLHTHTQWEHAHKYTNTHICTLKIHSFTVSWAKMVISIDEKDFT